MTEIYVDILLVINYVVNSLLLSCLARFAGRRPKGSRFVAAALVGAMGALTIFLPFAGFFRSMAEKLILSAIMVRIVFRWRGGKTFLREWLSFFVVSFFFAGAMLALWLIIKPAGMLFYNGVVYFDIPAMLLIILSIVAYVVIGLFWRFSRSGRISQEIYDVTIRMGSRTVGVRALVDTGNSLYEPFSGAPVMVCHLDDVAPLLSAELCAAIVRGDYSGLSGPERGLRFIRYNAVGGGGLLPAFRADSVLIGKNFRRTQAEDVYIAVTPGAVGSGDYGAILNPDLVVHTV